MQKQNQFWLFATDPTPSSPDQSDHQSIDHNHTYHPHTDHAGDVDNIDSIINVNHNYNYNINNNFHFTHNDGVRANDGNGNAINTNNNNIGNHHLVPSHTSETINGNSHNFDDFEEESLFSNGTFYDNTTVNDLESKDLDDDKHFQPIPPSPFLYEDDTTDQYPFHDSTVSFVSKPRTDDDDVGLDNCFPSFVDEDFYNFSPFDSSIGQELFERMTKNDEREVEDSFNRSESFASSVLSEYNNGVYVDEENDDFDHLDDIEEESSNCVVIDDCGNTNRERKVSQTSLKHGVDQQGRSSSFDMEFGNDIECHDDYYNFSLDDHVVASTRRRIASGGNEFDNNASNTNLPDDEPLSHFKASSRKRVASGDVTSDASRKIPRRCTSLGDEHFPSISSLSPNSQQDIINRSLPTVLSSSFSATNNISENNTHSQIFNPASRDLATRHELESSNLDVNQNWVFQERVHRYNDLRASVPSSNGVNSLPKPSTSADTSYTQFPEFQEFINTPSSNSINNERSSHIRPDGYSVDHQTQLLPLILNNDGMSGSHFSAIPSESSSFARFIPTPPKAANQECNNSHPFTVRPSSATNVYNNEIASSTAFHHGYSNANDTSLVEAFHTIQEEQSHNRNLAGQGFDRSLIVHAPHFTEPPVQTATQASETFVQNNLHETRLDSSLHEVLPAIDMDPHQTTAPQNAQPTSFHNDANVSSWANSAFTNGRSFDTTTSTISTYKATKNPYSNLSPDKPRTHGDIYTVPDMIHNIDTIGFQTETATPVSGQINRELVGSSESQPHFSFAVPKRENRFTASIVTPINIPASPLEQQVPPHTPVPILDNVSQVSMTTTYSNNHFVSVDASPQAHTSTPDNPPDFQRINNTPTPLANVLVETVPAVTGGDELEQGVSQIYRPGSQAQRDDKCRLESADPALEKAFNECLRTGSQTSLIKEELKRKIMYKRCVQGVQEVPSDSAPSPSSNQLTEEEEIKRNRRLESNRVAAARMRNRQKKRQETLNLECQLEEERGERLVSQVKALEEERDSILAALSHIGICIDVTLGRRH